MGKRQGEEKERKKKKTNHNYVGRKSMFSRIMRGEIGRGSFFATLCIKKVFVRDFLTLFGLTIDRVFKPQLLSSPILSQFVGMIGYGLVSLPRIRTVVS